MERRNLKELLEKLSNIKGALRGENADSIADLHAELKEVKSLLKELLLNQEIANLRAIIADMSKVSTPAEIDTSGESEDEEYNDRDLPEQDRSQALEQLAGMTSVDVADGIKHYLLHRPAGNFEYENSEASSNIYSTKEDTEWLAESELADALRVGKNPVVSCFIPEESIKSISGQGPEVGALDGIGKNPTSLEYKITVSPGTYTIYRQIKAMS